MARVDKLDQNPERHQPEPLVLTPAQAAVRIGIHIVTEYWLKINARHRKIPCTRIGRSIGFSEENIRAIVAQFSVPVPEPRTRRR